MYIFTALKEQPSSLSSLKKQQPVTTTLTVYLNQERSTASCKPNYAWIPEISGHRRRGEMQQS